MNCFVDGDFVHIVESFCIPVVAVATAADPESLHLTPICRLKKRVNPEKNRIKTNALPFRAYLPRPQKGHLQGVRQ